MNLAFLLPVGLVALAALVLPLLIHLARRSEQRPTVFAALRWLQAMPRPRHRLRFDEWLLLALRLLLLTLMALLLAEPVLSGADDRRPVIAVAPGAQPQGMDPRANDARWVWLAPGFPRYRAGEAPPAADAPVTSLLRELDADLPRDVALTVLVPPVLDGVDAQRPRLGRKVDWRVAPGRAAIASGVRPSPGPRSASGPRLVVRHAPGHAPAVRYLRAANIAWAETPAPRAASAEDALHTRPQDTAPRVRPQDIASNTQSQDIAPHTQPFAPTTRQLAWLAPGPVPTAVHNWVETGGVLLLDAQAEWPGTLPMSALWRDGTDVLVEGAAYGRGRVLRFTRELVPQQMPVLLDGAFPTRLRAVLEPPPPSPARVAAAAHAPLGDGPTFIPAPRDLAPWLIVAIALLFAFERWLATGHRGREAP